MFDVVECSPHRRQLEMRMAVDKSRQDRRLAKVGDVDTRMGSNEFVSRANAHDLAAIDHYRTVTYRITRDGQYVCGRKYPHYCFGSLRYRVSMLVT